MKNNKLSQKYNMPKTRPKSLGTFITSATFAKIYAGLAIVTLLGTTLFWSLLGARVQQGNSDQLANSYLFENAATLKSAIFPGQHTQLVKWPLFFAIKLFGSSATTFMAFTVIVTMLTVALLAFIIYKIEHRPLVFGTICLALASVLMLVPNQPYPGGILPVNMAMITTRNLEYILYIACLFMIVRSSQLKSWRFLASILLMSVLIASDKLFLTISLGGALLACVSYAIARKWQLVNMAANWLVATGIAAVGAAVILWAVNFSRLSHIASESTINPYGFTHTIKNLYLGAVYTVSGLLSNFGSNPATDTRILRQVPGQIPSRILVLGGVSLIINGIIFALGIFIAYRLLTRSLWSSKQSHLHINNASKLSLTLLWSTLAAIAVFIASNHYYPVDARYLAITLFAVFIATATLTSQKAWHAGLMVAVGFIIIIGILAGLPTAARTSHTEQTALTNINERNSLVSEAVKQHPLDVLVGDYWRVVPIKLAAQNKLNIMPLESCGHARDILSSTAWQLDLQKHSFTYLLSLDHSLTGYRNCTLEEVVKSYGRPNASTVIAGTLNEPKELLLFYDQGAHNSPPPNNATSTTRPPATVLPIPINELPNLTCPVPTLVNIVAHQDDDLLFTSPDLIRDIKAGHCVRTIYVTAGDAGADRFYWLGREQGSEAAYSSMLGSAEAWIQRIVKLSEGQYISIASPRNNPNVSLVFMHLPDGNLNGHGFSASRFESLVRLEKNEINLIHSVDGQSSYTSSQLAGALTTLMQAFQPSEIHTQANDISHEFPDHSDHMAVGRYAMLAYAQYEHEHFEDEITIPIKFYMGYPIHQKPENVSGDNLAIKTAAFLAYSKHDKNVCHTIEQCNRKAVYGAYLKRQYEEPQ